MGHAVPNALFHQFKKITDRIKAKPDMELENLRFLLEEIQTLASEPTEVTYEDVDAGGVPAIFVRPIKAASDRIIVYTHGGGCVTNSASSHRKMVGHLAKAAGVHALVVDYRLAPEHTFPAQIEDTLLAHEWLRQKGYKPEHTATAGDSAGGNLAITTVLKMRELKKPLPAAVIVFSPWLDMEGLGDFATNGASDALVSKDLSVNMSGMYLGNASRKDPLGNPLYADLKGFPPLFATAGDAETLQDNAERLVDRAKKAGVDTTLLFGPGQQHVYQFMAGRDKEADASIAKAATWLKPKLGLY